MCLDTSVFEKGNITPFHNIRRFGKLKYFAKTSYIMKRREYGSEGVTYFIVKKTIRVLDLMLIVLIISR
jgi:hypothetical protein